MEEYQEESDPGEEEQVKMPSETVNWTNNQFNLTLSNFIFGFFIFLI